MLVLSSDHSEFHGRFLNMAWAGSAPLTLSLSPVRQGSASQRSFASQPSLLAQIVLAFLMLLCENLHRVGWIHIRFKGSHSRHAHTSPAFHQHSQLFILDPPSVQHLKPWVSEWRTSHPSLHHQNTNHESASVATGLLIGGDTSFVPEIKASIVCMSRKCYKGQLHLALQPPLNSTGHFCKQSAIGRRQRRGLNACFLLLSWPFCQCASITHEGQAGGKVLPQLQAEVSSYLQCLGMGRMNARTFWAQQPGLPLTALHVSLHSSKLGLQYHQWSAKFSWQGLDWKEFRL